MINLDSKSLFISLLIACLICTAGCATSQEVGSGSPVPVTEIGPPPDHGTGVGCSWTGQCYRHPEKTKKEMERDLIECRETGTQAASSSGAKGGIYIQEMERFTSQCMLMRGYIWQ